MTSLPWRKGRDCWVIAARRLLAVVAVLSSGACAASSDTKPADTAAAVVVDTTFARLIDQLSEPGGYFDTDNLISNETSYLHVVGKMEALDLTGGAYIGVGPDQNFSYIAHLRPSVAFIIDIRRDNLLQHLFFKALFAQSRNRAEYLAHLFAKPVPPDVASWSDRSLDQLVRYVDRTPADRERARELAEMIRTTVAAFGVPLSEEDHLTIRRIHDAFITSALDLRFTSYGRQPRSYYPTYRQLITETDLAGRQASYVATEDAFRVVKTLQNQNLVIPVVGDLAGPHALQAIGRHLTQRGARVSFFYTSNVEFYLMRNGSFPGFLHNVTRLPYDDASVIARSYFGGAYRYRHPQAVPGYYSTQLLQTIASLVDEYETSGYRTYFDLVTKHSLELRR